MVVCQLPKLVTRVRSPLAALVLIWFLRKKIGRLELALLVI